MESLQLLDIIKQTNGTFYGNNPDLTIKNISTDSRKIEEGDLFIALSGENFDGHNFVKSVLEKGACGAVVSKEIELPDNQFILQVPDTQTAYQQIAHFYRQKFTLPIVSITGSNGKTTTKDLVAHLLSTEFKVLKTQENHNNEIGVPETLLKLDKTYDIAVIEMAMRARGQILQLAQIACPTIAIITNVGEAHIEFLGSLENTAKAKGEILQCLSPDGIAILNNDDPRVLALADTISNKVITFGQKETATVRAKDVINLGKDGFEFTLQIEDRQTQATLSLAGLHNIYNALAAAAVAYTQGMTIEEISRGLALFTPTKMRTEILTNGYTIINDTYNANPSSMKEALKTLISLSKTGRKIAILGDMLELGDFARSSHYEIGTLVAELRVDILITIGELAQIAGISALENGMPPDRVFIMGTKDKVKLLLKDILLPDDVILVKGSRRMKMEEIVDAIKKTPVLSLVVSR